MDRPYAIAGLFERALFLQPGVTEAELATLEAEGAGVTDTPYSIMPRVLGLRARGRHSPGRRAIERRRWALAHRFVGALVVVLLAEAIESGLLSGVAKGAPLSVRMAPGKPYSRNRRSEMG
jgi:hypothetical protein